MSSPAAAWPAAVATCASPRSPSRELAVEHFASARPPVVGHVTGPVDASDIIERRVTGFHAAARRPASARIERGSLDEAGGAAATERLLAAEPCPDGHPRDELQPGLRRDRGDPRPLARRSRATSPVIAADDDPVFDFLSRRRRRSAAITPSSASAAVDALLEQMAGSPARDVELSSPPALIERGSTARRRSTSPAHPEAERPPWPGTAFTSSSARRGCTTAPARSPACRRTSPSSACSRSCSCPTRGCSPPGTVDRVREIAAAAGVAVHVYTETAENPTTANLDEIVALYRARAATASSGSAAAARSMPQRPPRR